MFRLAERRGQGEGLYGGRGGLFLGPSALIGKFAGMYRCRGSDEVAELVTAAYGTRGAAAQLVSRLPLIREALQAGDLCRAMILAVHARIGPLSPAGIAKLASAEALAKYNFNPDEPRGWHGRWTDSGSAGDRPALLPVQELLPFGVRPPLLFEEPPETLRPFKEPIPRLSGKEGAKDTPSWARGERPYVGENGRDFARRLMDEQYGRGNWSREGDEYRQLHKYGDRAFRNPRSIVPPEGL